MYIAIVMVYILVIIENIVYVITTKDIESVGLLSS